MKNCYDCGRKFVKKVKNKTKECICTKWLCGSEDGVMQKHDCLKYLCSECEHEHTRAKRRRDNAKRQLTPKGKK